MKTAATILFLSLAAISCAQERKAENNNGPKAREKKRIASVTWDLNSHKLVWVVQKGTVDNGEFHASASENYEISPDEAVMAFAEERRGFTEEEAAGLHKLLDTLSLYCAESVVWWDEGKGQKLDGKDKGEHQKVEERKEEKKPDNKFAELMVAQVRP
jgi:hypothetical protein